MTIKVLAESAKDKGRLLNQIVKRLLDELGYDDFRVRIAAAGTDLEVKAKHRATQAAILCKARVLPREVGPDELKRFLAAYSQGKRKDRRLVGLFLAFSGLSKPAREWYAAMEEKGKGEFHVFAPEKLLALLRRARLIGPPEVVEPAIKSRIRTDAGPRFLAYYEGQFYWLQMTLTGRKPSGFAVLAVLLAAVGLYGLLSYAVSRRSQEIGVRVALGAGRGTVLRMVLGDGVRLTLVGIVIGAAGGVFAARALGRLLYGIGPTDPVTFVAVAVLLVAVALLASYVPAARATRVDPVVALRTE